MHQSAVGGDDDDAGTLNLPCINPKETSKPLFSKGTLGLPLKERLKVC